MENEYAQYKDLCKLTDCVDVAITKLNTELERIKQHLAKQNVQLSELIEFMQLEKDVLTQTICESKL